MAAEEDDHSAQSFLKKTLWNFVDNIQDIVELKDELRREGKVRDDIFEAVVLPSLAPLELNTGQEISFGRTKDSNLYIIEEGKVSLKIKSIGGPSSQITQEFEKGATFGELGVLFGISRISSIKCVETCKIWCLDRETFSVIFLHGADDHMMSPTRQPPSRRRIKSMKAFLKVKEVLALPFDKLQRLVLQLQVTSFEREQSLYVEGRCSTRLMLIEKGFVDVEIPPSIERDGDGKQQREFLMKMGIIGSVIRSQKAVRNSFCDEEDDATKLRRAMDPNSDSTEHDMMKSVSLAASVAARFSKKNTIRFGEGTLLGVGVIASKFKAPGAWPWKDEIIDGVPSVGAVSPVTVVASSKKVEVIYITTHVFENLFGPASSMYLFPSFLQKALDDPKNGMIPDAVGDLITMPFHLRDQEEEHHVDPTTNGYSMDFFDSLECISRNPLGTIVRAAKRMRKESVASVIYGGKFGPGGIKRPHILKIYSKAVLVRQRQVQKPLGEAEILSHLSHPFVMKLAGRFQTQDDLILVLENVSTAGAGDLWGLLHTDIKDFEKTRIVPGRRDPLVSLDVVRFYTASLVLAISHMHRHDIAYRNLRPENVLIDARGFIRLISFGNAKEVPFINTSGVEQTKTSTICGSTEYMAPEMVAGTGHDKMVDIWALGALLHEMVTGESPFARYGQVLVGAEKQWLPDADLRIMAKIATLLRKGKPVAVPRQFRGEGAAEGAVDIMLKFLSLNPLERPSTKHDIKQSDFFYNVDWRSLRDRSVAPPFIPPVEGMGESSKAEQARSRLLKILASPGLSNNHANSVKAQMTESNDDYRYDDPDDQDEYRDAMTDAETRVDPAYFAHTSYTRLKLRERGVTFFGRADDPKVPASSGKMKKGLGFLKSVGKTPSASKWSKAITTVATLNILSAKSTSSSSGTNIAPPDSARSNHSTESNAEHPSGKHGGGRFRPGIKQQQSKDHWDREDGEKGQKDSSEPSSPNRSGKENTLSASSTSLHSSTPTAREKEKVHRPSITTVTDIDNKPPVTKIALDSPIERTVSVNDLPSGSSNSTKVRLAPVKKPRSGSSGSVIENILNSESSDAEKLRESMKAKSRAALLRTSAESLPPRAPIRALSERLPAKKLAPLKKDTSGSAATSGKSERSDRSDGTVVSDTDMTTSGSGNNKGKGSARGGNMSARSTGKSVASVKSSSALDSDTKPNKLERSESTRSIAKNNSNPTIDGASSKSLNPVVTSRSGKRRESVANEFLDRLFLRKRSSPLPADAEPLAPIGFNTGGLGTGTADVVDSGDDGEDTGANTSTLVSTSSTAQVSTGVQLHTIDEHDDVASSKDSSLGSDTESDDGDDDKEKQPIGEAKKESAATPSQPIVSAVTTTASPVAAAVAAAVVPQQKPPPTLTPLVIPPPLPVTTKNTPASTKSSASVTTEITTPKSPQKTPNSAAAATTSSAATAVTGAGAGASEDDNVDDVTAHSEGGHPSGSSPLRKSRNGSQDSDFSSTSTRSTPASNLRKSAAAAAAAAAASAAEAAPTIHPSKDDQSGGGPSFPHEKFCGSQAIFMKFAGFTAAFPRSMLENMSKKGGVSTSFSGATSLPQSRSASPRNHISPEKIASTNSAVTEPN